MMRSRKCKFPRLLANEFYEICIYHVASDSRVWEKSTKTETGSESNKNLLLSFQYCAKNSNQTRSVRFKNESRYSYKEIQTTFLSFVSKWVSSVALQYRKQNLCYKIQKRKTKDFFYFIPWDSHFTQVLYFQNKNTLFSITFSFLLNIFQTKGFVINYFSRSRKIWFFSLFSNQN